MLSTGLKTVQHYDIQYLLPLLFYHTIPSIRVHRNVYFEIHTDYCEACYAFPETCTLVSTIFSSNLDVVINREIG